MPVQENRSRFQPHIALSPAERAERMLEIRRKEAADFNARRDPARDGYDCPVCLNRGMIMNDDGSITLCACQRVRESLRQLKAMGLDGASRRLTFDRFIAKEPWQQDMLARAQAFAASDTPGWLFLGGQSGSGKTHLCTAAAVRLLHRGFPLRYMRWMNDSVRLKSLALEPERERIMSQLIAAPVLYIDDLFKSPPTQADLHIAFELLDARYCDTTRRTIISSERSFDELMTIDEALAGRILERCTDDFLLSIPRITTLNFRTKA